jgi:hypothetical protein
MPSGWVRQPPDGKPQRVSNLSYALSCGMGYVKCDPPSDEPAEEPNLIAPDRTDEDGQEPAIPVIEADPDDNSSAIIGAPAAVTEPVVPKKRGGGKKRAS